VDLVGAEGEPVVEEGDDRPADEQRGGDPELLRPEEVEQPVLRGRLGPGTLLRALTAPVPEEVWRELHPVPSPRVLQHPAGLQVLGGREGSTWGSLPWAISQRGDSGRRSQRVAPARETRPSASSSRRQAGSAIAATDTSISPTANGTFIMLPWWAVLDCVAATWIVRKETQ
jgi:hypothetical protein